MEKDLRNPSPIRAIPIRHISPPRDSPTEKRMSNPQAISPSWDSRNSPPGLAPLKTKKNLLPYLNAADLETSSQAYYEREEHLLTSPEEEIDPELIEFVKRDKFHDLYNEHALEHMDYFEGLCDSYGVFDFEKKLMLFSMSLAGRALEWAQYSPPFQINSWLDCREAFLKMFSRKPPFKSKYDQNSYPHHNQSYEEEDDTPLPPKSINGDLIKYVVRDPFFDFISEKTQRRSACSKHP